MRRYYRWWAYGARSFWRSTPDADYVWISIAAAIAAYAPRAQVSRATPPRVSVANVRFWPIADVQKGYRHVRYQEKRSVICFLLFPKILQILCHLP